MARAEWKEKCTAMYVDESGVLRAKHTWRHQITPRIWDDRWDAEEIAESLRREGRTAYVVPDEVAQRYEGHQPDDEFMKAVIPQSFWVLYPDRTDYVAGPYAAQEAAKMA